MADARGIQEPEGTIAFGTSFLQIEGMIGRATQRLIWLWSKCGARKTMGKGGPGPLWWAIRDRRRSTSAGSNTAVEGTSASRAGANSVVRSSAGASCCPNSHRRFQTHCARI
jgi:hypothetical protein